MQIIITNGFGHTSNVGVYTVLQATVNLIQSVDPDGSILIIPWCAKSDELEEKYRWLMSPTRNVRLIDPILPAPTNSLPFPEANIWKKIYILMWSIWMNIRAELMGRFRALIRADSAFDLLSRVDLVVLPGHSYIVQRGNDLRSLASVRRVTFPLLMAQRMNKPTMLLNISVGPVENLLARYMVKRALQGAEYLSVREPLTAEYLKGFVAHEPVLSADTAFAFPYQLPSDLLREPYLVGLNLLSKGEYLEAVQGSWQNYDAILKSLAGELNLLMRQNTKLKILCIPHEMDRVDMLSDLVQLRKLVAMLDYPEGVTILETAERPEDVISAYARCSIALGMRFHGFVLAGLAATPMIGIDLNSQKVRGIAAALGVGDLMVNLEQRGQLVEQVSKALKSASELQSSVSASASYLRQVVLDSFTEFARSSGMSK